MMVRPFYRPTDLPSRRNGQGPPRPRRHVKVLRTPYPMAWKPDTAEERLAAFRWRHPLLRAFLGFLALCGLGIGAAWIFWQAMQ